MKNLLAVILLCIAVVSFTIFAVGYSLSCDLLPYTKNYVSITIDHNIHDAYLIAPVLGKYNYSATLFITGQELLGANLTQLYELQNYYHWDIAPHTMNHLDLTKLSDAEIEYELVLENDLLREYNLTSGIDVFAYPYGQGNDKVLEHVMKYYKVARYSEYGTNHVPLCDKYRITTLDDMQAPSFERMLDYPKGDLTTFTFHHITIEQAEKLSVVLQRNNATVIKLSDKILE